MMGGWEAGGNDKRARWLLGVGRPSAFSGSAAAILRQKLLRIVLVCVGVVAALGMFAPNALLPRPPCPTFTVTPRPSGEKSIPRDQSVTRTMVGVSANAAGVANGGTVARGELEQESSDGSGHPPVEEPPALETKARKEGPSRPWRTTLGSGQGYVENRSPAPVDLNLAGKGALDTLPGIGPVLAERIVAYRHEHGPFMTVDELLEVSGIGPKKLAKIRPLVIAGVADGPN